MLHSCSHMPGSPQLYLWSLYQVWSPCVNFLKPAPGSFLWIISHTMSIVRYENISTKASTSSFIKGTLQSLLMGIRRFVSRSTDNLSNPLHGGNSLEDYADSQLSNRSLVKSLICSSFNLPSIKSFDWMNECVKSWVSPSILGLANSCAVVNMLLDLSL